MGSAYGIAVGIAVAKSWAVGQRVGAGVDMAIERSAGRSIAWRTRTGKEGRRNDYERRIGGWDDNAQAVGTREGCEYGKWALSSEHSTSVSG